MTGSLTIHIIDMACHRHIPNSGGIHHATNHSLQLSATKWGYDGLYYMLNKPSPKSCESGSTPNFINAIGAQHQLQRSAFRCGLREVCAPSCSFIKESQALHAGVTRKKPPIGPMCNGDHPNMIWATFQSWGWYGYGSIPIDTFLVGWTSIYQLFWGSLGTRVLTHPHMMLVKICSGILSKRNTQISKTIFQPHDMKKMVNRGNIWWCDHDITKTLNI